ncbi:hypothetical protein BU16DRAFT_217577 [Lophium mytilinum]|uniref:Uncharacterized protein n=1 Tax=Lophium mytilinum TaxID=390894 RepID=A0A6A6QBB7_9PEZI|nr:hypothetical protein BU16DRAFT_217577 [Lophium mytilinum]
MDWKYPTDLLVLIVVLVIVLFHSSEDFPRILLLPSTARSGPNITSFRDPSTVSFSALYFETSCASHASLEIFVGSCTGHSLPLLHQHHHHHHHSTHHVHGLHHLSSW